MKKYGDYSVKERMEALSKLQSINLQNVIIVSKYKGKVLEVIVDGVLKSNQNGLVVWDKTTGTNISTLIGKVNNLYVDDKGVDIGSLYQAIEKTNYSYGGENVRSYYNDEIIVQKASLILFEVKNLLHKKSGITIENPTFIMVDSKGNKLSPLFKVDLTNKGFITYYAID